MTPEQRTLRARMGAYAMHSRNDSKVIARKANKTFIDSFEKRVDPNFELPVEERQRRAAAAYRLHMLRMAFRSVQARKRKRKSS